MTIQKRPNNKRAPNIFYILPPKRRGGLATFVLHLFPHVSDCIRLQPSVSFLWPGERGRHTGRRNYTWFDWLVHEHYTSLVLLLVSLGRALLTSIGLR
jgi:prepilin-type processing-associated H-X9-DG protein